MKVVTALWAFPLLLLAAVGSGCAPHKDFSNHVELVKGSEPPTPAMTFELRFESDMVKGDRVGLTVTNSPLVLQPPLAGTFTWLSTRSGVFTPKEPLALDAKYELSLRPDLRRADGQLSDAVLHSTVKTPAFGVITAWPHREDLNADSEPEIKLAFNADVRAAEVAPFLYFVDATGKRVAANVQQGTVEDRWADFEYGTGSLHTWKEDATAMKRPAGSPPEDIDNPTNVVPNLLVVAPQQALPVGQHWKLIADTGIPSADGTFHSRAPSQVSIGDITPFTVQSVTPLNYIRTGASLRVEFSKPVPEFLTNHFRDWVELSDVPTNLTVEVAGRRMVFSGSFQCGRTLTLKLRPGFPAAEPFTLQGDNTFEVTMPHVAPRLYFPAMARDQLAGGHRTFPLLTINVARVRIRAKLMDPNAAIHALRGYQSYFASEQQLRDRDDWSEPYRAIDYNVLPGTTVCDKEIDLGIDSRDSDAAHKLDLNWDELLAGRRTGVVFLDAQAVTEDHEPALGTQALIQLTDLGLIWKKSPNGVDVCVFSHTTGQPVPGATARVLSDENQSLQAAITDTNGLAHLAAHTNADWVAVQSGDDFHAVVLDRNRVWQYRFEYPSSGWEEPEDVHRVMMFSDRDLYRPGESMHLEAIVREWGDQGLRIPANLTGKLECLDARDKVFFRTNAIFSRMGSWSTLVPLPVGPRGYYSARLQFGTNTYDYSFQVRDFQPSAFETALPCKGAYGAGETIELPLSAHYLFGKKLSRAQVKWSLQAEDMDFRPERFQDFSFGRSSFEFRYGRGRSSLILNGQGILSGASNFIIAPKFSPNAAAPLPRSVSLLAEVTDLNQQTLSRRVEFVCHSSDFYLGMRQATEVLNSNTPPALEILALGTDGKPWPEAVQAHLTLQQIDWQTVRVQGAGRTVRYHNEAVLTNLMEKDIIVAPISDTNAVDSKPKGNLIADLPPLPAGEYLLEVKAQDAGGRAVISSLNFSVSAPAEAGWNYRNDLDLTLKPDQKECAPGDTAQLLVEAPFSGTALVTVEREKVLRSFLTTLTGNAPSIRVPIEPGDVPNVMVSVVLLRGSDNSPHQVKEPEYRIGSCTLPVTNPQNRLAIDIACASTNVLPGQPVDVTVQVTEATHKPVAGAEVVLYAVDDGILGLTGYTLPDPYAFFYAARPLGVQTSISLPNLLTEDPEQLDFQNKGYLGGGGGRERVRKNFLACAFWSADLQTDADGKVHASFIAPDSLTRYRLFAVVHTSDSHFGSSQSAFHVTKPLIVEPALPAFANITDHLQARALVLNQTTNAGDIVVSLDLDDKASSTNTASSTLTQQVFVPANGSATVDFPIELTDTGETKWIWRARFADSSISAFADAVQSAIPIGHIAPLLGEVLLSRVSTGQSNLLALANPQLLGGRGTITINVANTRLNELGQSAAELLHYPYGCAEQTGSSLLPWILLRDTPGLLPDRLGSKTNDASAAIRAGVARLLSMQSSSGGLGYWPHAKDPMLWASAYGGMVLAIAQRHGIAVPKEEFESLCNFLSQQLRSDGGDADDLSDQCLALYALAVAGRAEPAYQEKLFSQRQRLAAEDRALLALAIAESHGADGMIADLLNATSPHATVESRFGCPTRADAIRLLAWIHYRPADPTVDRLVSDLMLEQKQAHWETTQGNAWALLALTDYARLVETKLQPAQGQITYGAESIDFVLDDHTNVFSRTFVIHTNTALSVSRTSTNLLYTTISIEARPPESPQPRQDRGFSLQRRYDRLCDDNQPQPATNLLVGDRVLVTLRLGVRDTAKYMVIDDALPATLEAVNPEFRTQEARATDLPEDENWWMSDFREIRKDRSLYFADWVPPGNYTLRYVARVRAAGTVTAPSAKAEEMYHPEHCGLTESQVLVSEPLK